jgi:hypothetical protein
MYTTDHSQPKVYLIIHHYKVHHNAEFCVQKLIAGNTLDRNPLAGGATPPCTQLAPTALQ